MTTNTTTATARQTVTVEVFHNEDARFGRGYEQGDTLTKVHEFEAPVEAVTSKAAVSSVLEDAFRRYNIGECEDAQAYRGVRIEGGRQVADESGKAIIHEGQAYGIRSLSVGDVLVLGESAFTVAPTGFDPVTIAD